MEELVVGIRLWGREVLWVCDGSINLRDKSCPAPPRCHHNHNLKRVNATMMASVSFLHFLETLWEKRANGGVKSSKCDGSKSR